MQHSQQKGLKSEHKRLTCLWSDNAWLYSNICCLRNSFVAVISGTDGIILVDTSESSFVIAEVMERFRNITSKPLKAIVITHFHAGAFTPAKRFDH